MSRLAERYTEFVVEPGRYKHFKGGYYTVLFTAQDSETRECVVVYRSEETQELWTRPVEMFAEMIDRGGRRFSRFQKVG